MDPALQQLLRDEEAIPGADVEAIVRLRHVGEIVPNVRLVARLSPSNACVVTACGDPVTLTMRHSWNWSAFAGTAGVNISVGAASAGAARNVEMTKARDARELMAASVSGWVGVAHPLSSRSAISRELRLPARGAA
jgi:hypothetical protein